MAVSVSILDVQRQLRSLPLFHDLTPDLLDVLAAEVQMRTAAAGTTIFRLGDAGDELFVVLDGRVQIYLPAPDGGDEVVAELASGRWFGEMALITGEPRSASARAATPTKLLVMSRTSFLKALERAPALALTLSHELSRRLRTRLLQQPLGHAPNVIALDDPEPTPTSAQGTAGLVRAVADEIGTAVGLVDLTPTNVAVAPGPLAGTGVVVVPTPKSAADLAAAARSYSTLLVRLMPGATLGDAVRDLPGVRSGHDALSQAAAGGNQLEFAGILSSPLQQLARRLLCRRVGLVLGAGGAKGMAHIGVLRCFEQARLRFDMLAGTSIGACMAAFVALGWDSERLLDFSQHLRDHFRRELLDFGVPSGSLLRGRKKRLLLQRETQGRNFEDLPVPLWTVAADLIGGREAVFGAGALAQALDATTAIPTIFPPVTVGDRVLVDGWVVNPFPSDVLRRAGVEVVIGVDPCVADGTGEHRVEAGKRRGWWRRTLNPLRLIDPAGIVRVAMRSMDVGARENSLSNLVLADVCVQPALGAYSTTDLQKLDRIVAAGEAAASAVLPTITARLRFGAAARIET